MIDIHKHRGDGDGAIRSLSVREYSGLAPDYAGKLSVGIHPWDSEMEDTSQQLEALKDAVAKDSRIVAIGEIGLDSLRGADMCRQTELFERQLQIAKDYRKPVIIHCVKAYESLLQAIVRAKPETPLIVHGFRGNRQTAEMLLRKGLNLSFGERFNNEALQIVAPERLFAETDESSLSINEIIDRLAQAKNISPQELATILRQNIDRIFCR